MVEWRIGRRSWRPSMSGEPRDEEALAAMSLEALTHRELVALLDRREPRVSPPAQRGSRDDLQAGRRGVPGGVGCHVAGGGVGAAVADLAGRGAPAHRRGGGSRATTGDDRRGVGAGVAGHGGRSGARGDRTQSRWGIIQRFFERLPGWVDPPTRAQAEATLGRIAAAGLGPEELRPGRRPAAGAAAPGRRAAPPMPSGPARAASTVGRQGADGMTEIRGLLDPRSPRHPGCGAGQVGRPGHVQPRRRNPVCGRPTRARRPRANPICAPSRNVTTTR